MAGPEDEKAASVAGPGYRRASRADREQVIDVLKAAFVQGRLTKDEFDARIGLTFTARAGAELAAVTADVPARPAGAPPRKPSRLRSSNAARWGAAGFITPAIIASAFAIASVGGAGVYEVVGFLIASVYFISWLSVGANMLWEWHCMCVPAAGMCVRCAHTVASHRTRAACTVRLDLLSLRGRCPCAGYVPPGTSPETVEEGLLPAPSL